ncbi:MAG TPA: zinc-binding dehydrogenase [Pseudonocardiaceae bacterium]|jgi:NADPH:quinone reductase-like Zn-dependent oxidoreductase
MLALAVTRDVPGGVALREVPEPVPAPDQVVIEVAHSSLNSGEVHFARSDAAVVDSVPGWDAAGVVIAEAADGSGPPVGSRVTGFGLSGGWGRRRAVSVSELAVVPAEVDLATAAALPVSGVTALRALRRCGSVLGRRVLVTGAAGGVGRLAVQLAVLSGAIVVAATSRPDGLDALGAHEIVADLDGIEPVDVVLENVGSQMLVAAWQALAPGGIIQSIGWTRYEPAVFPHFIADGEPRSIHSFKPGREFGPDLAFLLGLLAAGRLPVEVGWRGSWEHFAEAADALLDRRVPGKAVLDIGEPSTPA